MNRTEIKQAIQYELEDVLIYAANLEVRYTCGQYNTQLLREDIQSIVKDGTISETSKANGAKVEFIEHSGRNPYTVIKEAYKKGLPKNIIVSDTGFTILY